MSGSSYGGEKNFGGAYSCWNCRKRENKILRIGRGKTETYVIDFLKSQVEKIDPAGITELVNRKIDTQAQKGRSSKLAEDLAQIEASIRNITKAVESGVYSQSLLDRLSELEHEKEQLHGEQTKLRLQQVKFSRVDTDQIETLLDLFKDLTSYQLKRDLVEFTLNSVKVIWDQPRVLEVRSIFEPRKILFL
jgi:hypothetical protein